MAIALTLILTAQVVTTDTIESGWASQYAPGRMLEVVRNRQRGCCGRYSLPAVLPDVDGFIAVAEREDIGRLFYLRPVGGEWELFLAADCAGLADGGYSWMKRGNILAEVDYATALRWGTVGRGIRVEMMRAPVERRGYGWD